MYPAKIKFCLLLKFLDDGRQAKFQLHLADQETILEAEKGQLAILGKVRCYEDGFPIEYDAPPELPPEQVKTCEWLIHSGIAWVIPQLLLVSDHATVWFTHTFPAGITQQSVLMVSSHTCFHLELAKELAIKD